jgi:hypothetical protein
MKETTEFRVGMQERKPGEYPCSHWRQGVLLNEEQRTVHCNKCDASLDPFDALMALAKEHDRIRSDFGEARKAERETRTRIEVLRRLENNMRARLKRLGADQTDTKWGQRNLTQVLKDLLVDVLRDERLKAKGAAK